MRTSGNKHWCCERMERNQQLNEDRGVYLFAKAPIPNVCDEPSFWLAVQGVRKNDLSKLLLECPAIANIALMLETELPITFCPWCGRELSQFYSRSWEKLVLEKDSTRF
ncbi:hypothetical protein V22_14340 [Calycomorphotria hydatis]|uniref:Uncharacterized protein n=1 Tax=Calycomorphotria hydatis TaxID=2528027 RepID=A0A517T751_9PLAN|nr:hypothetical protein V22_14340 [Calycomorphotria hydatis]